MNIRMPRRPRRRRSTTERGATAVEFALLAPLLFALLFGIITAGLGYNNTLGLADGVREGSRFGSTLPSAGWSGATVQQHTIDSSYITGLASANVCVQLVRAPSTVVQGVYGSVCGPAGNAPATPTGVTTGACLVKVWAQMPVTLTFVLIPSQTIQVHRQSVSLYERGTC